MSVVSKWSIPVATLAITLLTVYPPAQCEKLSPLKQDSVHRRQTVLHTSLGSIRWYQSDEMWLCRSVLYVYEGRASAVWALLILFPREPPLTRRPERGLTLNRSPWTPPSCDTIYSQVTGGVFLHRVRWQLREFLGLRDVISASYAVWRMGFLYKCVKTDKQDVRTSCRGVHGHENNQTTTKLQVQDDEATSVIMLNTTKSGCCVYNSWATTSLALPQ